MPSMNKARLSEAIQNPSRIFRSPDEVLAQDNISQDDKLKILESWETDQNLLMTAEEENMPPNAPNQGVAAEKLKLIISAKEKLV